MPKSGLHRLPQVQCPLLVVYSQFKNVAAFPYQSLLCKSRIKDAGACTLPWLPRRNCLYPSFVESCLLLLVCRTLLSYGRLPLTERDVSYPRTKKVI
ncbi:hypothetical protein TcasGA2_TC033719 [Tribolium castaneum]|uniref:Uncharacterized protein n=1 Tax=Tribolium castaneum TaxID=7070 RepID=A0A139WEP7_TRICA|nr:hypothetical protein TcasGA2_TC033719 [Tribolium castaneum]